jgi:hypothetical protein
MRPGEETRGKWRIPDGKVRERSVVNSEPTIPVSTKDRSSGPSEQV